MMTPSHERVEPALIAQYPAVTASVGTVRKQAVSVLEGQGIGAELIDKVALALSELATNAVEASAGAVFSVEIRIEGGPVVSCAVRNRAAVEQLPDPASWRPEDPLARRGRGLGIVDALADTVSVEQHGSDVVVTALIS